MKVCPPTVKVFSQASWEPVFSPVPSSAAADTMVNAVPGVSLALSASAPVWAPDPWCWATARTSPVDARTATICPEPGTPLSAASAAFCAVELMVVRTGVPASPGQRASTPAWVPAEVTATISVVGVPRS